MEWALVSCMTCFSEMRLKKQGWVSEWLQTESWDNPVSEMKENMVGLSEFLPFICVLCPPIPVKLWIEMGIRSYTILCFLFILAGRTSFNLFFACITPHYISLFIFSNTESDYDFYLGLHFCEVSKLIFVFNHWPCCIHYSCCGSGKHLSKLEHIPCGVTGSGTAAFELVSGYLLNVEAYYHPS